MRASWYAKALYALADEGKTSDDVLVHNLVATVNANGHAHMFPAILRSLKRLDAKEAKKHTIIVTTAEPASQEDVSKLLRKEQFATLLSADHKRVERNVDSSIVGGAIVKTHARMIDTSHKTALWNLYQEMTAKL